MQWRPSCSFTLASLPSLKLMTGKFSFWQSLGGLDDRPYCSADAVSSGPWCHAAVYSGLGRQAQHCLICTFMISIIKFIFFYFQLRLEQLAPIQGWTGIFRLSSYTLWCLCLYLSLFRYSDSEIAGNLILLIHAVNMYNNIIINTIIISVSMLPYASRSCSIGLCCHSAALVTGNFHCHPDKPLWGPPIVNNCLVTAFFNTKFPTILFPILFCNQPWLDKNPLFFIA